MGLCGKPIDLFVAERPGHRGRQRHDAGPVGGSVQSLGVAPAPCRRFRQAERVPADYSRRRYRWQLSFQGRSRLWRSWKTERGRRTISRIRLPLGRAIPWRIYGTRGALVYKFFTEEMQGASEGSEQTAPIPVPAEEERFHTTDAEFIAAIREGGPVSPDFEDGVRYMSFCEAVALSAESGQAVELPLQQPAMLSWGRRL